MIPGSLLAHDDCAGAEPGKNISNVIKSISAANMSKQEASVLNKLFVDVRVR